MQGRTADFGRDGWRAMLASLALVLLATACGGGGAEPPPAEVPQEPPPAEAAPPPAPPAPAAPAAADPEPIRAVAAHGLAQVALGRPASRTVDPVAFERLMTALAEVPGWVRADLQGEEHSTPVPYSIARARYTRGGWHVTVEVIDTGLSQLLLAPYAMFLAPGFEERTTSGITRSFRVDGSPAFEGWNGESGRGEMVVVVRERFLVKAAGAPLPDLDPVRQVLGGLDLAVLANLR